MKYNELEIEAFPYGLGNQNKILDLNEIKDCNIVIITLGTSSDKHVIKKFNQLIDDVISKITEGSTIILRSTVTLNTINKIIEGISRERKKEKKSKLFKIIE